LSETIEKSQENTSGILGESSQRVLALKTDQARMSAEKNQNKLPAQNKNSDPNKSVFMCMGEQRQVGRAPLQMALNNDQSRDS
jgi:hypothetical protein